MGALDPKVIEQGACVGCLLDEGARSRMPAAAGEAATVVGNEPVVIGQGRLRQERGKGIRQDSAVDEQHRLAAASDLVFKFPAID
jgi:hypothetical protein